MTDPKESPKETFVRISDSRRRDAGRGFARVDPEIQKKLKLHSGDGVMLENAVTGKKTVALIMHGYSEDDGTGIIRIDGSIRRNLKASIDERVLIRKIDVSPAQSIVFAPVDKHIGVRNVAVFAEILENRIVMIGDTISFDLIGRSVHFVVKNFSPKVPAVQISRRTKIQVDRKPVEAKSLERTIPRTTYEDLGGVSEPIQRTREMIELPLRHPELFNRLGISPPKGLLLYGPPGTGKTLLARAVANETDAHFITLSGPEIMSKFYGQSEENLRKVFEEAKENAPSIIFIDEIDSIAAKREEVQGEVERRVVAQLLALMDGLDERGNIVVIGATNRPNSLDEALRRPGRFDREIEIGVPNKEGRLEILQIHSRGMPLLDGVDLKYLAEKTHGFVGADLQALAKEAAMIALRRILPDLNLDEEVIPPDILNKLTISQDDFKKSLAGIEPSALREVLISAPTETWADVGGLEHAKQQLQEAIEWPIKFPNIHKYLKTKPAKGILLYGLPGTGKTLLAKALAHEAEANFISIKGPELISKWVGESEKAVRETFRKARQAAPCIIFMDEIDAIAPTRGRGESNQVTERIVSQLLTEIDGMERLHDVVLVAATNRPDILDPALMRAGRFGKQIEIPLPDKDTRVAIFNIHLKGLPLDPDIDLNSLASSMEGKSGADIESFCSGAVQIAIRSYISGNNFLDLKEDELQSILIKKSHFDEAMEIVVHDSARSERAYNKLDGSMSKDLYS
ncbi:CDC48 family AAA ATPase [Candidatus Lokiarchaeum ossiferum]|uniref:CDC48 family AAA ATPase n=1 Tax=Candidatus Lokiarchaeum ossiferum TaxID=2951803 RepID=UPI00352EDD17